MSEFNKMSKEELDDWNELYKYVKFNVMKYDERQSMHKNLVLRLLSLRTGRNFNRLDTYSAYEYTFKEILMTFKAKSMDIEYALRTKNFDNDDFKFNYILAIIKNNINDIALRMKEIEKQKNRIESLDTEHLEAELPEYKPKQKKINKRLQDLL